MANHFDEPFFFQTRGPGYPKTSGNRSRETPPTDCARPTPGRRHTKRRLNTKIIILFSINALETIARATRPQKYEVKKQNGTRRSTCVYHCALNEYNTYGPRVITTVRTVLYRYYRNALFSDRHAYTLFIPTRDGRTGHDATAPTPPDPPRRGRRRRFRFQPQSRGKPAPKSFARHGQKVFSWKKKKCNNKVEGKTTRW